MYIFSKLL